MIAQKHISKFIIALMALAVAACIVAILYADKLTEMMGGTGLSMEYETALFDTDEIITIDIKMDEDDWDKMLNNATSEEYYVCDVVVNGKTVKNVGIRPKGNTSLSAIAMDSETNRYSFKLEFDQFVENQTCFGLDKLILNNNYADATNMKEAVIYDMYQYLEVDSSLYNYAKVSVNGEYWGVYLALEAVEESFALRNYGTQDGELYKPDSLNMNMGSSSSSSSDSGSKMPNMGNFNFDTSNMPNGSFNFDTNNMPSNGSFNPNSMPSNGSFDPNSMPSNGSFDPNSMPSNGNFNFDTSTIPSDGSNENKPDTGSFDVSSMGGFSMGGSGSNLNYTDDDLDSYSTIWQGEVTSTTKADHRRVVTALKNISEGTDLETYLDVDNILKYMAVHTFSVNMDSLSGSMAHNYYLYEYDGQLNIIPWDYNLSLGGMSMGAAASASDVVNDAIDTPFSGTKFFDALLNNEEYLAKYHEYLRQLVDEYVNGGRFDQIYNRIRSQIDGLVETDPTAFYSYDEYLTAADILYNTVKLRAESIDGQLKGTIPSTDAGQSADSSSLIDASSINIEAMGQFNMSNSFSFGGNTETGADSGSETGSRPSAFSPGSSFDFSSFSGSSFSGSLPSEIGQPGGQITGIIILAGCLLLWAIAYAFVKLRK